MNTSDTTTEAKGSEVLAVLFLSIASSNGVAAGRAIISMQRERGEQKAADLHARVIYEFIEVGSSVTNYRKRHEITELFAYLDENANVRYVIFPTVGRLSRKLEDFQELMSQFDNRGVVVTFPYGDPAMSPTARDALWLATEWTREQSLAARTQRRRKASAA